MKLSTTALLSSLCFFFLLLLSSCEPTYYIAPNIKSAFNSSPVAFGEMWFHNDTSGTVFNITSNSTYFKVNIFDGSQGGTYLNKVSYGNSTLFIQQEGDYKIIYSASYQMTSNHKTHTVVFINDSLQLMCTETHTKGLGTTNIYSATGVCIQHLFAGSNVSLYFLDENFPASSITFYSASMALNDLEGLQSNISLTNNLTGFGNSSELALWDSNTNLVESNISWDGAEWDYHGSNILSYGGSLMMGNGAITVGNIYLNTFTISSIVSPLWFDSSSGEMIFNTNGIRMANLTDTYFYKVAHTSTDTGFISDNLAGGSFPSYILNINNAFVGAFCLDSTSSNQLRLSYKVGCQDKNSFVTMSPTSVVAANPVFALPTAANIEFWGARESFSFANKLSASGQLNKDGQAVAEIASHNGSFIAISSQNIVTSLTASGNYTIQVYKNGVYFTNVTTDQKNTSANTTYQLYKVFNRNAYKFLVNDSFYCYFNKIGGTYTGTIGCTVEVQYDT